MIAFLQKSLVGRCPQDAYHGTGKPCLGGLGTHIRVTKVTAAHVLVITSCFRTISDMLPETEPDLRFAYLVLEN
jgi:hypothetical protein